MKRVTAYLKMMRVHHYIKNLLIYAALICGGQLFDHSKLYACTAGFLAFCLVSSCVYILNDIRDVAKDQNHPTKRYRPLACGEISVRQAIVLLVGLLAGAVALNGLCYQPLATGLLFAYVALNVGYSFGLKNYPIADIAILASGFLIRVLYGAVLASIDISNWLYLTVFALAFYFALGKRRNEINFLEGNATREVLKFYTAGFLEKNMYMCLTLANAFYALWCMDKATATRYQNERMVWTVPLVLLITLKYSLDVNGESDGDPVEVLLRDKTLITLCVLYAAIMLGLLYW